MTVSHKRRLAFSLALALACFSLPILRGSFADVFQRANVGLAGTPGSITAKVLGFARSTPASDVLMVSLVGREVSRSTDVTAQGASDFFAEILPWARDENSQYRVPMSVTMGQSAYETAYGTSGLWLTYNNYHGLKSHPSWGRQTGVTPSGFAAYAAPNDSFLDHGELLNFPRYSSIWQYVSDPKAFIREVAADGYCPDAVYADNIISIMDTYNLYQYDGGGTGTDNATFKAAPGRTDSPNLRTDYFYMNPGEHKTYTFYCYNTGTSTWPAGGNYYLHHNGHDLGLGPGLNDEQVDWTTSPGNAWTKPLGLIAPSTPGVWHIVARMENGIGGTQFGDYLDLYVMVGNVVGLGSTHQQKFVDCFIRNGGAATVGQPTNQVHSWGANVPECQDFTGGSGWDGQIQYDAQSDTAYWVYGSIKQHYNPDVNGHAITDANPIGPTPYGTSGVAQDYRKADGSCTSIYCKYGGSSLNILGNNWKNYRAFGGPYSRLGWPVGDGADGNGWQAYEKGWTTENAEPVLYSTADFPVPNTACPPSVPDGKNGWYVTPVQLQLKPDGCSVDRHWQYAGDAGWTDNLPLRGKADWDPNNHLLVDYTGQPITIDHSGSAVTVNYYSDMTAMAIMANVGGQSPPRPKESYKSITLKIDLTAPTATMDFAPASAAAAGATVNVHVVGSDDVSGFDHAELLINTDPNGGTADDQWMTISDFTAADSTAPWDTSGTTAYASYSSAGGSSASTKTSHPKKANTKRVKAMTSGWGVGTYAVRVNVWDQAGNQGTQDATYELNPPAPTVISTAPVSGAAAVAVNTTESVTFSRAMDTTKGTFSLADGGAVAENGSWSTDKTVYTFTPKSPLLNSTKYTATLTGFQSADGVTLSGNPYSWSFTTVAAAPTVVSTNPANGVTGVAVNTAVTMTFSRAMNTGVGTFSLADGGSVAGSGIWSAGGTVYTFTPSSLLLNSTKYTATLTGFQSGDGVTLSGNPYSWSFTTVAAAPTVSSTTPASGAANVAVNTTVAVTFSRAMNTGGGTFALADGGTVAGNGSWSTDKTIYTFTPGNPLANLTKYTATLTGFQSADGVTLSPNPYSWTFTTVATAPTVVSTTPVANASVAVSTPITVHFSRPMDTTKGTFSLADGGPMAGSGNWSSDKMTYTFTPSGPLLNATKYTATLTGFQSADGVALPTYSWSFTTIPAAPTVVSTNPVNGAMGVAVNTTVAVTFSRAMNTGVGTFGLADGGPVAGSGSWSAGGTIYTFTPSSPLLNATKYTATLTGFQSGDGGALPTYPWTFTTVAAAPTVSSTTPASGAGNVPVNMTVSVTFSRVMNTGVGTFSLADGGAVAGSGSWSAGGTVYTFTPSGPLQNGTKYTATLTGFQSADGVTLSPNPYSWQFTTVVIPPGLGWTEASGYTSGGVAPAGGGQGQTFSFQVKYTDAAGVAPAWVHLVLTNPLGKAINGSPFTMTSDGTTNYQAGVVYSYTLPLNILGQWKYQFVTSDGTSQVQLPGSGEQTGPTVQPGPVKIIQTGVTYPTIQAAINAAVKGQTVAVSAGTYKENLDFKGKAITVRSLNPTNPQVVAATIINGNQQGSVVTFKSKETAASVLEGFTLTNGTGTATASGTCGGGVYCTNGSSPTLSHNIIKGNSVTCHGGGICCFDKSSPTLTDNLITKNSAKNYGGGLCCGSASPTLTGNTFTGNSAYNGGGVFCDACSPTLTDNIITGNSAVDCGGAVACVVASPILIGNTLSGNSAVDSGGGVYCVSSSPTLTNNLIIGNLSYRGSGVCCNGNSSPTLTNDTLSGNVTSGNKGAGVYCCTNSSPVLKSTIVALNTKGGGLYLLDNTCQPVVTYCDFYGNTGGNYVGTTDPTGKNGDLGVCPDFANPAGGNFHLRSKGGHWNPVTKQWVTDTMTSPCIDAGDPTSAYNLQPTPNGGRIEMGAYGDTCYASKSPTAKTSGVTTVAAVANCGTDGVAQITVTLASAASVQATILNIAGREVAVLEQALPQGISTMRWDGKSNLGTRAPAGRYLVRVTARSEDGSQAQTMTVMSLGR